MGRDVDLGDLRLIVRALHQDVSTLDERLRRLETEIRELRESMSGSRDLVVIPSREARHSA